MLEHVEKAADAVRSHIMGISRWPVAGPQQHPLHPQEPGGKLALFAIEALCLILRSQTRMQEQLNRLNSVIDQIGSRLGNITTDLQDLLTHLQGGPEGDSEVDVGMAADRVQAILDRLGTIDQAIVNASSPAAQAQGVGSSPTPTPSGDGSSQANDGATSGAPAGEESPSSSTSSTQSEATGTATGDGTELAAE